MFVIPVRKCPADFPPLSAFENQPFRRMQAVQSSLAISQRIIPGTPTLQREPHMVAMYSAFIVEGTHDKDYDAVLTAWNGGCVELVCEVMGFVPYLIDAINAVASACGDDLAYLGVLEYEVAAPFGLWIAQAVAATGSMPSPDPCRAWLNDSIVEFFAKHQNAERTAQIKPAVSAHAATAPATSHQPHSPVPFLDRAFSFFDHGYMVLSVHTHMRPHVTRQSPDKSRHGEAMIVKELLRISLKSKFFIEKCDE
ncbi:MAG: hypothetical protein ABWY05_07770 [Noviherbaspirillum sp.]